LIELTLLHLKIYSLLIVYFLRVYTCRLATFILSYCLSSHAACCTIFPTSCRVDRRLLCPCPCPCFVIYLCWLMLRLCYSTLAEAPHCFLKNTNYIFTNRDGQNAWPI